MSNMELWYTENQTNNVNFSMKVKSHLYSKQSDFQKIDIIDTYEFGKVLVIDNWTMVTYERVSLFFEDGIKFVKGKENLYDLIIIDSTDPIGPGEGLFTMDFYTDCFNTLTEKGILINQCESPYYPLNSKKMKRSFNKLNSLFPICEAYQYHIPTYPSGHWMFCFASKTLHPIKDLDAAYWNSLGLETKYYNTDLHVGCFALPNYVKAQLIEE